MHHQFILPKTAWHKLSSWQKTPDSGRVDNGTLNQHFHYQVFFAKMKHFKTCTIENYDDQHFVFLFLGIDCLLLLACWCGFCCLPYATRCAVGMANHEHYGDWKNKKKLGSGGFGQVCLWENTRTGEKIAIKVCRPLRQSSRDRWQQEVCWCSRYHCFICNVFGWNIFNTRNTSLVDQTIKFDQTIKIK